MSDWRPIETAPKEDEAEYLVWNGHRIEHVTYDAKRKEWWVLNEFTVEPSHWFPLPQPPTDDKRS